MAQFENLGHDQRIVVLASVRALVRGAGTVGGVNFFPQGAVIGVGDHREVTWEFQRHQPAFKAFGLCGLSHLHFCRLGEAGKISLVGDVLAPGLSCVQQLVGETAGQLREFHLDGAVTLLLSFWQVDTRQAEITQGVLQNSVLGNVVAGCFRAVGERLIRLEQGLVLADFGPVFRQLRQARLISATQFGVIAHRIQVAHRAPCTTQAFIHLIEWQHQPCPRRRARLFVKQLGHRGAVVSKNGINRRLYVLRANG